MQCFKCRGEKFRPTTKKVERKVGDQTFRGELPAHECAKCGALTIDAETARLWDPMLARAVARQGAVSAEGFKLMRELSGLQGKQLAEILGVTAVSVSRWENGARPIDQATWKALAEIVLKRVADPDADVFAEPIRKRIDVALIPPALLGPFPNLTLEQIPEMLVWANPGVGLEHATASNYAAAARRSAEMARLRTSGAQLGTMSAVVSIEDAEWLLAHGAKAAKDPHDITEAALEYGGLLRAADSHGSRTRR